MMGQKGTYVVLWEELLKSDLLEPKIYARIEIESLSKDFENGLRWLLILPHKVILTHRW
jgi:hypothetical protein